jgi:Protein of unknown function (DUF3800)
LYIDDSGSRNPDQELDPIRNDRMDWFALGGVLIDQDDVGKAIDLHRAFIDAWGMDYPLHSTKIRGRRKEFSWLGRDEARATRFYTELRALLVNAPVLGIACVIDRPGYNERYREKYGDDRWLMCKTAYSIVVERALKFVRRKGAALEVFYEEAGKEEDRNLLDYHKALKASGMPFDKGRSAEYGSLGPEEFQESLLGDPTRLTKKSSLIQMADLYIYPLVKAGYDDRYRPYLDLAEAGRVIDAVLQEEDRTSMGIKYSCFDLVAKGERPSR